MDDEARRALFLFLDSCWERFEQPSALFWHIYVFIFLASGMISKQFRV